VGRRGAKVERRRERIACHCHAHSADWRSLGVHRRAGRICIQLAKGAGEPFQAGAHLESISQHSELTGLDFQSLGRSETGHIPCSQIGGFPESRSLSTATP
jgi:hypothetical protein